MVLGSDGGIHTKKVPSSVDDYARPSSRGSPHCLPRPDCPAAAIDEIRHGTTVASNAILEHKGARVGLITTKGFRDVLEIRTLRMPRLYDLTWTKPTPLVERYLRKVVDERIDHRGNIERPLDPADAERAVDALLAEQVEAIAICLINSFTNPAHELAIKHVAQRKAPQIPLSVSFEVLPEIKEYERTSTTVINAYVMPIVATYLRALRTGLDAAGIPARLLLMQSNGGLTTDLAAVEKPMNIVESGPAGGVVGAQAVARAKQLAKIITFDMGGTTAKASMVENGEVTRAQEYAVGAGIMIGSRLLTGAGYTLRSQRSIWRKSARGAARTCGSTRAGRCRSARRAPAPHPVRFAMTRAARYQPSPTRMWCSATSIRSIWSAARSSSMPPRPSAVFAEQIATPLKMTAQDAAYGAHQIAASNMIRAIRAVSSERGRDPREFALFAFGGNGPLFAAGMAAQLGITRIIVPPSAGLFSSFGLLYADVEHHYARTFRRMLRQADPAEIATAWDALAAQAAQQLAVEGFTGSNARLKRSAALHYKGQTYELTVPVPDGTIDGRMLAHLEEAFGVEHEKTYGHRAGPDEPVELVAIQLVGSGLRQGGGVPQNVTSSRREGLAQPARQAYFGAEHGWLETPVLTRAQLATPRVGPLIVEEYDATCLVPPGACAERDAAGNIVIALGG